MAAGYLPMTDSASNIKVLAVIPARYGFHAPSRQATGPNCRPPDDPARRRARPASAQRVSRVIVATEDERMKKAVEAFGGEAILTRPDHRTGTDRVAEVATHLAAEIYVNVQGDEPLIDPGTVDAVVAEMLDDESIQIATPCTAIDAAERHHGSERREGRPRFRRQRPLFFARSDSVGSRHEQRQPRRATGSISGLYAFRRDALLEFPTLPPGELERIEQLEQLRWLENGFRIRVVETDYDAVSVDVPADVERVEKILQERATS